MIRRLLTSLVVLIIIAACGLAGVFYWGQQQYRAPGPLGAPVLFMVKPGQGVTAISEALYKESAISDPQLFRIAARLTEQHTALKAGEYELLAGMSMEQILDLLESGKVYERKITVPEGLTSWQIVGLINEADMMEGRINIIPPDGALLPETYHYTRNAPRQAIVSQMSDGMNKTLEELWPGRASNLPFSTQAEAVTLASIVEKETGVASERKRIAGVFINRLKAGMLLQSDPTVIYALTDGRPQNGGQGPLGRRLLKTDLTYDSPYNTYKYPGLPPGPIANPGRASLEAVLNPEEHDYLFFVADGTGGHVFAKTLAGHNKNVMEWRKIRAND